MLRTLPKDGKNNTSMAGLYCEDEAMKIICHKNDGLGLIESPVIMISCTDEDDFNDLMAAIPAELQPCAMDDDTMPSDRMFFMAWRLNQGQIHIDLASAKIIAHDVRRSVRDQEFESLDALIMKQIPGTDFAAVEVQRQAIRDKYSAIQVEIDAATDVETLTAIVHTIKPY